TYTSSNNAVATVTTSGLATGTAPGTVTFTATSEGVSGTQVGTVRDVRASFGSLACQGTTVGRSCTTSATLRFADNNNIVPGTARVTTIESSNPSIARVENITYTQGAGVTTSATLVGVSPGTVTITARYSGLNGVVRTDSYTFTVSP
ncbi:MAG TPA: Ig-like domain-containing protein, partial [Longimicrobium sp.]